MDEPRCATVVSLKPCTLVDENLEIFASTIDKLMSKLRKPWSIKDSFAKLDLQLLGFEILFEASWIWREASDENVKPANAWTRIRSSQGLLKWEQAWRHGQSVGPAQQFPIALLQDPSISFFEKLVAVGYSSGCIANKSSTVTGITNFFSDSVDKAQNFRAAAAIAQSVAPEKPLIGYERGDLLLCAECLRFQAIGHLRIWHTR